MAPPTEDEEARRRARQEWPIAVVKLEQTDDDLSEVTTLSARIASMWPLAVEAYTLAGRAIPTYERRNAPSKVFQPGEARDDEA